MNKETFKALNRGDIIEHKMRSETYLVESNYGNRVTAVKSVDMTDPDEWDLIHKASYRKPRPTCKNCQDPKPGKCIYVTVRGPTSHCAECGRILGTKEEQP